MIQTQSRLLNVINSFTKNTFPHSVLLLGEEGSGHQDICNYIANKFDLWPCDITEFISLEYISEIQSSTTKSLYYIDMSKVSIAQQNILLKLYEEPSQYAYIVLNSNSDDLVLDTILNRSYILRMDRFKRDYLTKLIDDKNNIDLVLSICTTPGQIELANHTDMPGLKKLCESIIEHISTANYQNTLSISNKINFTDEYDKYDLSLFIKMLKREMLMNNFYNKQSIYSSLNTMSKYIKSMNNKQQYFENFLTSAWELSRK